MRSVVVVGAGVAGTAAALAARAAGARVRVVAGATGASTLAGGALDFDDWSNGTRPRKWSAIADRAFSALDFASLPDAGVVVATTAGILRPAAGADRALLDLDRTGRGAVLVPRSDHPSWDGPALARAWAASPIATKRELSFVALDVQLVRMKEERFFADAEIAARHDDPERLAWLAERLREVLARNPGFVGVLLPPWLGASASRADDLSKRVGVRCGETLAGLAGPSGARFENARARAFATAGVDVVEGFVSRVARASSAWRVTLEDGAASDADAVVLATGGLVGGGLAYAPGAAASSAELPPLARPTLRLSLECTVPIGAHGAPASSPSTLFGAQPEAIAWPFAGDPWLDRAGVLTNDAGAVRESAPGLFACGDLVADRPRAWLDALESGARAGDAAAHDEALR